MRTRKRACYTDRRGPSLKTRKETQIGFYDPTEADLEHYRNTWSARFFRERLQPPPLCGKVLQMFVGQAQRFTKHSGAKQGSSVTPHEMNLVNSLRVPARGGSKTSGCAPRLGRGGEQLLPAAIWPTLLVAPHQQGLNMGI